MAETDGGTKKAAVDFELSSNFEDLSKRSNLSPEELKQKFYERGEQFWRSSTPTLTTMLGGLEFIRGKDAADSKKFIRKLKSEKILTVEKPTVACDCACGIGRVTRDVLLDFFDKVDLVEMVPEFLAKAPEHIFGSAGSASEAKAAPQNESTSTVSNESAAIDTEMVADDGAKSQEVEAEVCSPTASSGSPSGTEKTEVASEETSARSRVERLICSPLQSVELEAGRYDVVWLQWAAGQLEDGDLIAFFRRSVLALKPGGCVVVKDNVIDSNSIEYDSQDGSYLRPLALWQSLISAAGVRLLRCERVRVYPKTWHPVYYFVFRAREENAAVENRSPKK